MKYIYVLLYLFVLAATQEAAAQKNKKPQVLVYGSDILAYTAALQSAQSGVPTLWVADVDTLVPEFSTRAVRIDGPRDLDGGLWLHLLMDMALSKKRDDSLARVVKLDMNPRLFLNAMERSLTKYPDLQIIKRQKLQALKYDGKAWAVQLDNKQKYNVRCIIDASVGQRLGAIAGIAWKDKSDVPALTPLHEASLEALRTLVASGAVDQETYGISLAQLLQGQQNGFFSLATVKAFLDSAPADAARRSALGQALGATAAYLAFFKTNAAKIDVRKLQSELMTYGMRIMPYADAKIDDPHYYALQRFGLSAIFPLQGHDGQFLLEREETVSLQIIQPVFQRLYSRSQLWFADNKGDLLKWDDFLSLLRFVGLRGEEVDRQVEKDWSTKLQFAGHFDPEAYVTRYQFAVVLDLYASPYVKAVNQDGIFIN